MTTELILGYDGASRGFTALGRRLGFASPWASLRSEGLAASLLGWAGDRKELSFLPQAYGAKHRLRVSGANAPSERPKGARP